MRKNYADPATVDRAVAEWGAAFALPRVDAVFVPGGDSGHTEPVEALEQNWRGLLAANNSIARTLTLFKRNEQREPAQTHENWRLQQVLYRAYYDAYLQQRGRKPPRKPGLCLRCAEHL